MKHRLLRNSISILISRVVQSLVNFVLTLSIARILGPFSLGQYMLAYTYYLLFMTIGSQGLKVLFARELSRAPEQGGLYLGNGTWLQLSFGLVCYFALAIIVTLLPYSQETTQVCYVLGLAVIPFSLSNVPEAIFQAFEKLHLMAISTVPVYILRVSLSVMAMLQGYDIILVCWIQVISEFMVLAIEWVLVRNLVKPVWKINWQYAKNTVQMSRSFIVIEGVSIIQTRMHTVILSLLAGEIIVGLYGAINQLLQPFQIITHSLIVSIFPSMSKSVALGIERQRQLAQRVLEVLLLVALPSIVILFFLGREILIFLFREPEFALAGDALKIMSLALVSVAIYRPLGYVLVANNLEWINKREVIITTVLAFIISVPLIWRFQLVGAAVVYFVIQASSTVQYLYAVRKRLFSMSIKEIMLRPASVTAIVTLILFILIR